MKGSDRVYMLTTAFIFTLALCGCETFGKCNSAGCQDDAKTTIAVKAALKTRPELGSLIRVQTKDGIVYLYGRLDDVSKATAGSVARQVPGVVDVVNSIATYN
jgi:osmotically-inducible protein OsmY